MIQASIIGGVFLVLASVLSVWLNDSGGELTPERSPTQQSNSSQSVIGNNQGPKIDDERKNDVTPSIEREPGRPKLWITYAWDDNEGGNFDFLIGEMEKVGIDTTFDKVALVPGQRLWEQIATQIEDPDLHGWAILLTEHSINSQACREELAYALDRALRARGQGFPLLGLLHQVNIEDVPAPLRVRVLVDLRNPEWPQLVASGLEGVPPDDASGQPSRYLWKVIEDYRGPGTLAVHVLPRFQELRYWRFIYPVSANRIDWGHGPPQKAGFTGFQTLPINDDGRGTMTVDLEEYKVTWIGTDGDVVTPGGGCYIVFGPPLPDFVGFVVSNEQSGSPLMETLEHVDLRNFKK